MACVFWLYVLPSHFYEQTDNRMHCISIGLTLDGDLMIFACVEAPLSFYEYQDFLLKREHVDIDKHTRNA